MIDLGAVAIFISVFSILIAAFSLGWNIYRDVILKPKVKVAFGIRTFIELHREVDVLCFASSLDRSLTAEVL